jgi:hypothetical protein
MWLPRSRIRTRRRERSVGRISGARSTSRAAMRDGRYAGPPQAGGGLPGSPDAPSAPGRAGSLALAAPELRRASAASGRPRDEAARRTRGARGDACAPRRAPIARRSSQSASRSRPRPRPAQPCPPGGGGDDRFVHASRRRPWTPSRLQPPSDPGYVPGTRPRQRRGRPHGSSCAGSSRRSSRPRRRACNRGRTSLHAHGRKPGGG